MEPNYNDVKMSVVKSESKEDKIKPFYDLEWFDFVVDKFLILTVLLLLTFWHQKIGPFFVKLYQLLNKIIGSSPSENETRFSYTGIILGKILSELNADRVIVGKIYYEGSKSPYELGRLEIVREVVAPGIEHIRKRFEDIPLKNLESEFKLLKEQGRISVDKNSVGENCRRHLSSIGIEYTSTVMIKNLETTIGILSIQHRNSENGVNLFELSEKREEKFTQCLDSLVYYLTEDFLEENRKNKKQNQSLMAGFIGRILKWLRSS
jgi:hypothetical protein